MKYLENLLDISLTHFDEGGAAATGDAGGAPAGDTVGTTSADGEGNATGGNEPGSADQGQAPSPEERAAAFKKFKVDFKDLYDQDVQNHITRRLKKYSGLEQSLNELNTDVNEMLKMLNVTDRKQALTELRKIQQKRLEDEAYNAGMSIEEYRRQKEQERRIAEAEAAERRQYELRQRAARHHADAIELQKQYPEFNLRTEAALNPQFLQILDDGKSVKFAYEVTHAPEILAKNPEFEGFDFKNWQPNDAFFTMLENGFPIENAFKTSEIDWWEASIAKRMEKRTADNIKAGNRPKENGASKAPAVNLKKNPSAMTGQEVKDLADKILRGEIKPEDVRF